LRSRSSRRASNLRYPSQNQDVQRLSAASVAGTKSVKDKMMVKTVLWVVVVFCSVPSSYAVGALARNPSNNDGTVVINKSTRDDAIHDALLACGSDCEIVTTFQNSCVAYAADHKAGSTVYGYGKASDKDSAGEQALNQCQSRGGSCTVMDSGCDGR
jgi:hypothetical protein